MTILNLNGIEVNFPFEPYECQKNYMKAVLDCLVHKKNGILESPTGTGKTLCLLCSSISWLIAAKADMQFNVYQQELSDTYHENICGSKIDLKSINKSGVTSIDQNGLRASYPKIIYASRTHSQLTQVVKELKMSHYNSIKTCVIGSRDQLCINPQVNTQKNYTIKMNMCKSKVNAKTCYFHNNIENNLSELKNVNTVDIEDLVKFGNKFKCCPYYIARNLKDTADVLFMPYNYLLDKKLRKSNNIDLKNSVIIFDEAHNVERICEDSASSELTSIDIASAMEELAYLLDEMKNELSNKEMHAFKDNFDEDMVNEDVLAKQALNTDNMPVTIDELAKVQFSLKQIEEDLDMIKLTADGLTKPASNKAIIFDILQRLLQFFSAQTPNPKHHNGASLAKYFEFLQVVFTAKSISDSEKVIKKGVEEYKVHIKMENNRTRVLCYWCFSPSATMEELLNEGARCIILTSGTLSPIGSLKIEMKIPFDIVLENPHIIKSDQIKVLTLAKGPKNIVLKSNYENRSNEQYLESLGQLVLQTSEIVPHGVLVFFPSYPLMDQTIDFWRKSNIWQGIGNRKCLFIESKNVKDCNDTILKYYERIKDPRSTGAIMFAVCRGKMSEGIDFADNYGRAVIITGLPYPPYKDPRVVLKKQYLDSCKLKNLSGQDWYSQQAFRAVNQAVGRVIRHKDDFGAILLCDERFGYDSAVRQMPKWICGHVKKMNNHEPALIELRAFFKITKESMPNVFESIKSTSTQLQIVKKPQAQANGFDVTQMINGYGAVKSSDSLNTHITPKTTSDFFNALNDVNTLKFQNENEFSATHASSLSDKDSFQNMLAKRKEQEKRSKCKVVIKDKCTISETNISNLSQSRNLLDRIYELLSEDENTQFKLALSKFYVAKKNTDEANKLKYFNILKLIFENKRQTESDCLFNELKTFIRYREPTCADKNDCDRVCLKRKLNEND